MSMHPIIANYIVRDRQNEARRQGSKGSIWRRIRRRASK